MPKLGNYKAYNIIQHQKFWEKKGVDPQFLFKGTGINHKVLKESDWLDYETQVVKVWRNHIQRQPNHINYIDLAYEAYKNRSLGTFETIGRLASIKFIFKQFPKMTKHYNSVDRIHASCVNANNAVMLFWSVSGYEHYFSLYQEYFLSGLFKSIPKFFQTVETKKTDEIPPALVSHEYSSVELHTAFSWNFKHLFKNPVCDYKEDAFYVDGRKIARKVFLGTEKIEQTGLFANKKSSPIYTAKESDQLTNLPNQLNRQGTGYQILDDVVCDGVKILRKGDIFNAPYTRFNVSWEKISLFRRMKYLFTIRRKFVKNSSQNLLEQLAIADKRYEAEIEARERAEKNEKKAIRAKEKLQKSEEERKKLQNELLQVHKMEAIGTLAGGIAHDFNNILSGILGYSQLAKYNFENPKDVLEDIKQIEKAALRATDLVSQILKFSRQSEDNTLHPLKLSITLKEVIKLIRSSIPTSIEIKQNIYSNSKILSDPTKLHQVIMNLCTNAYHAMRDNGGILTVEVHDVEIVAGESLPDLNRKEGAYVKLVVKDTGHGIDKETKEKIFDPYFTTKEIGKGTGLGLSVVDGIVKSQNGFIKISSQIDLGTIIEVFWPKNETETHEFKSQIKTDLIKGNGHLMLVDDEITILKSLEIILKKNGWKTTCFRDSPSALRAFEQNPERFDAVITDMTMPKMAGDRLSKEMLKIRGNTPIILCSGYNENIDEEKIHDIGIRKFVRKPIQIHNFLKIIQQTISSDKET